MDSMFLGLLGMLLALSLAPLVAGFVKKVKALLQNRRGFSIWQPYFDLDKLLHKDRILSLTVSIVFLVAPYLYFAAAVTAAGLTCFASLGLLSDFLLIVYVLALGRFCLALASLDAGSAFGGMGGSREVYISVLVEPALLLSLLTVALPAGTTGLSAMIGGAADFPLTVPYVLSAAAFFIVAIAETGRIPVDNPDTHLELTMVHEGMVLEYSGRELALIHWAAMVKQFTILLLFARLFIPWTFGFEGFAAIIWMASKVMIGAVLLALVETSTNKLRLFKLPGLLSVSGLLSVLALIAQ